MHSLWDRLLRDVRSHERPLFFLFSAVYGLLSFSLTLGLAGSEALFIATIGISALPLALVAASLLTVLGSLGYAFLVGRWHNDTLFTFLAITLAVILALLSPGLQTNNTAIYAVFCLFYLGNAVLNNHYWNCADEFFDATSAKRIFPLLAIVSSAAGVLGGIVGQVLNDIWGPVALIIGWTFCTLLIAGIIYGYRQIIRSWGRITLNDDDGGAWDSLKRAVQYMHKSPLSMWLTISALLMVLALFISQYLYQDVIAAAFPKAQDLATFMNYYLIVTNLLEIAFEGALLPLLLVKIGIPRTNLLHPLTTVASLLGILFFPGLNSAIAARVNRELLDNALASPVRTLVYNALPARLRSHMRSFLEGVVIYAGMAGAGIFLQISQAYLSTNNLIIVALVLACGYLLANTQVLRYYLQTLVTELREGKFDWSAIDSEFGSFELERLGALWRSMITDHKVPSPKPARQLTATLGKLDAIELLLSELEHPCSKLRCAIAEALALSKSECSQVRTSLLRLTKDPEVEVVCASLHSLHILADQANLNVADGASGNTFWHNALQERIAVLVNSPEPRIVAAVAPLAGELGQERLEQLAASADASSISAAIQATDRSHRSRLEKLLNIELPSLKAQAALRLVELGCPLTQSVAELRGWIMQSEPSLSQAAIAVLGQREDPEALTLLASTLTAPKLNLRRWASRELQRHPALAISRLEPYLYHEYPYAVAMTIETLGSLELPEARQLLLKTMRTLVQHLWQARLALHTLQTTYAVPFKASRELSAYIETPEPESLPEIAELDARHLQYLVTALEDYIRTNLRQTVNILTITASKNTVNSVIHELKRPQSPLFGQALEVLSNLEDHEATRWLVLFFEQAPLVAKLPSLPTQFRAPSNLKNIVDWIEYTSSPWLRHAITTHSTKENPMDHLIILRQISLFEDMSLDQLSAIEHILIEEEYLSGEVVFKEGATGTQLFLLIKGSVDVVKGYGTPHVKTLATLDAVNYFGEMAILDDEPRSATIIAHSNITVLILDGEAFKELIRDMPDIAFDIMRALTQRIRTIEKRIM